MQSYKKLLTNDIAKLGKKTTTKEVKNIKKHTSSRFCNHWKKISMPAKPLLSKNL